MHKQRISPMTSANVDEFDIRVHDSHDLVVSVILVHAPWSVTTETYQIS